MPTRTIKVYGHTEAGATATFTFNGIEVFNGTIASAGTDEEQASLFTFDISTDINGYVPGILSVTSGTMCVSSMQANYSTPIHGELTKVDPVVPAVDASEITDTYGWMNDCSNTSTINRVVDGVAQTAPADGSLPGALHAIVTAGDASYTADWAIDEAIIS